MNERGKLRKFLNEVIHWRWDEFCAAEFDTNYKSYEAAVFSLIRTAAEGKLSAIKLAIDRVDGKIETPVEIVYPKVWMLYPEATGTSQPAEGGKNAPQLEAGRDVIDITPDEPEPEVIEPEAPAVMSLRETLNKMSEQPRSLTSIIKERKKEVEILVKNNGGKSFSDADEQLHAPLVKSIIAANLLSLAENGNFDAVNEVFEQIDGKLVETIKVLGDDIYLTSYALEAPAGALKNEDGVYMIEATEVADQWKQKLKAN